MRFASIPRTNPIRVSQILIQRRWGESGFGASLQQALEGVVDSGHQADARATEAAGGGGNITDVVAAVSKAELALQTTVAIRDRVVQAYQDIMRMPI